jgi:hypothetical protein
MLIGFATRVSDVELRYSANNLRGCAAPPNAGRAVRARDILLAEISHLSGDADVSAEFGTNPPAGVPRYSGGGQRVGLEPFDLGRGVMLGHLHVSYDLIRNACEARGHFFKATGGDGVRYAFSRYVTAEAIDNRGSVDHTQWDADQSIFYAVALSRYVRDNSVGTDIAARVVDYESGAQQVVPRKIYDSSHTYRLPLVERDWLDENDAAALRLLLEAYWRREPELPGRVGQAMWQAEYAAWTQWADHAIPLIVAAFESLFATRIEDLTRNFKRRLSMLAAMFEVDGVDADFAERPYVARSEGVHGHAVSLVAGLSDDAIADIRMALGLLRETLRRLIEHDTFSSHFVDKASIDRLFGFQTSPVFHS